MIFPCLFPLFLLSSCLFVRWSLGVSLRPFWLACFRWLIFLSAISVPEFALVSFIYLSFQSGLLGFSLVHRAFLFLLLLGPLVHLATTSSLCSSLSMSYSGVQFVVGALLPFVTSEHFSSGIFFWLIGVAFGCVIVAIGCVAVVRLH